MGHCTRDAEIRVLPKGTPVAQFGLAINRTFKTESGEQREEVLFVDCECWGKVADIAGKWFKKGKALYVDGRLKMDSWEDKTTHEKKSRMKIVVEQFQFLGDGKGEGAAAPQTQGAPQPQRRQEVEDEIQF